MRSLVVESVGGHRTLRRAHYLHTRISALPTRSACQTLAMGAADACGTSISGELQSYETLIPFWSAAERRMNSRLARAPHMQFRTAG